MKDMIKINSIHLANNTPVLFFADTYALIEIIKGSAAYEKYVDVPLVTTEYNLIELYYHCVHDHNVEIADFYFELFRPFVVPLTHTTISRAMLFKLEYVKEKLSYVDCIGYAVARELGVKFLTGDLKFETKENVEWVK